MKKILLIWGLLIGLIVHAQVAQITTGTAGTPDHQAGPIYRSSNSSAYDASRYSYLYTASELAAAGITSGAIINDLGWVKNNNATTTGGGIFRIYMKNSTVASYGSATATWASLNAGTTLVYQNLNQAIPATQAPNYITFALNAPFTYTGGSLEISVEWDISQVSGNPSTAAFSWLWSTVPSSIYGICDTALTGTGTLSSTNNSISGITNRRPFLQIGYSPGTACSGAVTAGTASASVSNTCANTAFNLSLTGATSGGGITYQWQSSPAGANTFTNIAGATTLSYSVTNQTVATDYRCVVTCTNGGSTQNSSVVSVGQNSGITCLNYCPPVNSGGNGTLINNVLFGTINNNSSTAQPTASPYYTFYPSATTTVVMGTTENLSITISTAGTYTGAITSVWIDWNQDGTLSATEHFYVGPGSGSAGIPSGTTLSVPVTIPVSAVPGLTRMRIRTRGNANPNLPTDACTNFGSGETEDYNITVVAGTACTGLPVSGTASAAATNACAGVPFDLTLTGYTFGGGITYQWYSSPAGAGTFTAIAGATAPIYTVASQTAATDYRCVVTCTNSSQAATSNTVSVGQNLPSQCYCTPTGGSSSTSYYLNSITTTGGWTNINYTATSYNAYINSNLTALTSPGNNVNVNLASAGGSTYYYKVWIDWNNDGFFSDPGELVLANTSWAATLSGTIPVPAGTALGNYRVRCFTADSSTGLTPCGPAPYGSYVDFTLAVVAPPTCLPPTGLTVTGVTGNSATLNWNAPATPPAGGYEYWVSTSPTTPTGAPSGPVTGPGTTVTLPTTLTPSTVYYWWVRAVCSGTDKSYLSQGPSFTTTQIPATLPYIQPFTGPNDFGFINGSQVNKWFYGSATGNTGNSIYISNNNGTANAYTTGTTSVTHAYRDIAIPAGTSVATFSFDWKAAGEGSGSLQYDYLRVWLVPASFLPAAGTAITAGSGRIQVGHYNLQGTTWQTFLNTNLNLTSFATGVMRLVFEWTNDSSGGTQPPAAVDNIILRVCSTATPVVTVVPASITHNSANITWPQDIGGASYQIRYRPVGTTQWLPAAGPITVGAVGGATNGSPLSNLTPYTLYEVEVAAVCNNTNVGTFSHNEFMTKCDPTPPNITVTNITSTSALVTWNPLAAGATYELQWREVGTPTWWPALPSTPQPPANTYLLTGLSSYKTYEVQVRNKCIGSLAFNPWSTSQVFTTVRVCEIPPPGLTITQLTPTTAEVVWDAYTGPGATNNYILRYRKVGIPSWTTINVSNNTYTITGLLELTKYEMQVANVCTGTPGNFTPEYYFTTPTVVYCQMHSTNFASEFISKVTAKPTGKPEMINITPGSAYSDFTTVPLKFIDMVQGSVGNQIIVDKTLSSGAKAGVAVWIDFDRSGTFDLDERILADGPNTNLTASATFTVPADAFVGSTDKYVVMRVAMAKDAIPVNCISFTDGEVEDYTVRISKLPAANTLNQTDILIYPNPVKSILNVKNVSKKANYKIYSAAGQLVSSGIILNNKIDVSRLINGVYVIDIDDVQGTAQKKFIKE
ncbi:GEVED domain-containing protein [Chryseobacterium mulctrae]|uniref:GEVED domain-containing protein n=1 Tax=Chryseobacterium mulctrae TaxID=2576777 RepID=UPI001116CF0D|nr:GEVED domain-containing protein [Chryseobacterium mulctrae]